MCPGVHVFLELLFGLEDLFLLTLDVFEVFVVLGLEATNLPFGIEDLSFWPSGGAVGVSPGACLLPGGLDLLDVGVVRAKCFEEEFVRPFKILL